MDTNPADPITPSSPTPDRRALLAGIGGLAAGALLVGSKAAQAGPLNPPSGPVASTPGPEPRIAINAANTPGTGNATFRITQPGSYYLTANVQGAAGKSGIEIAASNVTIDLNGFALLGVAGSGAGIVGSGVGTNIAICNGFIRDWGSMGINLTGHTQSRLNNLNVTSCAANGMSVASRSLVRDCLAVFNGANGFAATSDVTFDSCAALFNAIDGFSVTTLARIAHCLSRGNDAFGIRAASNGYSVITDNLVAENQLDGIRVFRGCIIARNDCAFNNTTGSAGIRVTGGDNRIEDNLCASNAIGIAADDSGNFIVRNTCSANPTNWSLVANNVYGPIVDRSSPASAAVTGNSASSSLGSTDANANFTF
jgi:parallel beta-helix repeat protein